ncbi:MAG: transposase [Nitrospiraceae bacterium]|nr:transposase [Nitrospiraceae bacterium]
MRSRYRVVESSGVYFLTATVVEWVPVFIADDACCIVTAALDFCRLHKGLRLYAYVIMENHIHLVAEAPDLIRVVQAFKRHTARELVQWAENTGKNWMLNQFGFFKKRYKRTSRHQVWQEGVHPQILQDDNVLRQKIEYIHNNPVRRGYVDTPEHWRYSSARNFMRVGRPLMALDELGS